jgi:hypothetical protein
MRQRGAGISEMRATIPTRVAQIFVTPPTAHHAMAPEEQEAVEPIS